MRRMLQKCALEGDRRDTNLVQNIAGVRYVDKGTKNVGRHWLLRVIENKVVGGGEGVAKGDGRHEHFDANQEILNAGRDVLDRLQSDERSVRCAMCGVRRVRYAR